MQMEEAAQRIRRLARDICPGEPLGKKGCSANSVSAFAAAGNHPDQSGRGMPGFHLHQRAPRRYGALKKTALSPSAEHEAGGTPSFIWSPHLIEMG